MMDDYDDSIDENATTLRLKEALNISDIVTHGSKGFTFELDPNADEQEKLAGDIVELDTEEDNEFFYNKHYIGDKGRSYQPLLDSITDSEQVGDFEDVIPLMTDVIPGKVKKLIVREGREKDVVPSDGKVVYHCVMFGEGKQDPIDSSIARGAVNSLVFSSGKCLEGIFIGLQTMKVGEIAKVWIHYDLAYGAFGAPPRIPKEANILCVIQILAAFGIDDLQNVLHMTNEQRDSLPYAKILETVKGLHLEGNKYYGKEDYKRAVSMYKKGIDILDNYAVVKMADEKTRSELLGTLYNNIAQAYLKDDQPGKACAAAKNGLKIPYHPQRYKLYFRFAKAKVMYKDFDDALNLCKKAMDCLRLLQVEERVEIGCYMTKIAALKEAEERQLGNLYKNMLVAGNEAT